ncbi:MAG TPA: hypothetical protein VGK02_10875 [Candidatus Aquicultor sp.]
MENIKCSEHTHICPEKLDVCCQFCTRNYSPCEGKCSGCWDQIKITGPTIAMETPSAKIKKAAAV